MNNLDLMLKRLEHVKTLPEKNPGTYLHLGCGPNLLSGFYNIDKFEKNDQIVAKDICEPLTSYGSVDAIYSSHALEHLPNRKALTALINWCAVLKPGGKLFLAIPDLGEICRIILDNNVSDDLKWGWYIYTLFGYQIDPTTHWTDRKLDHQSSPGQYHLTGFTVSRLQKTVSGLGMVVDEIFTYDGWSTPSIWMEATKIT